FLLSPFVVTHTSCSYFYTLSLHDALPILSVSVPIWSKIGERMGNKFAFELSLALFILGSVLEGVAPDIYFFLISRVLMGVGAGGDRKSTRLNSSHVSISFAVFCLKKKK